MGFRQNGTKPFLGHYCLEHSKQFSDKYHSIIIIFTILFGIERSMCISANSKYNIKEN